MSKAERIPKRLGTTLDDYLASLPKAERDEIERRARAKIKAINAKKRKRKPRAP